MKLTIKPITDRESIIKDLGLPDSEQRIMLEYAFFATHVWTVDVDGDLISVFGLIGQTLIAQSAYLWVYGTDNLDRYKFVFARHSQEVLDEMLKHYPVIVGHCVISNRSARRWLKWLGAKFSTPVGDLVPFEVRAG
jgi:hypothetical protein